MGQINILIVDDSFVVRRGLRTILEPEHDIFVLGEASTGQQAIEWMRETHADVVLMDIHMPGMNGIRTTEEVLKIRPESNVIIMTGVEDPVELVQAIVAGAKGYLVYGEFSPEGLKEAVRMVSTGGAIITPSIAPVLLNIVKRVAVDPAIDERRTQLSPCEALSPREMDVLDLIATGKGNSEIAKILHIEQKTVKNHINSIYSKLGLRNRHNAITYVLKRTYQRLTMPSQFHSKVNNSGSYL